MKVIERGRELPAIAQPLLLGITKASLNTQSFLSAASSRKHQRRSSINKVDGLIGLKEIIISKLIRQEQFRVTKSGCRIG